MTTSRLCIALLGLALCAEPMTVHGQDADPDSVITVAPEQTADTNIAKRIRAIFAQISALEELEVTVNEGVVTLTGPVSNERFAERALDLALRLEGVVTVEDQIERTLDVDGNVRPVIQDLRDDVDRWTRALPLMLLALVVFLVIVTVGYLIAGWSSLWQRVAPNGFLAALIATTLRVVSVIAGLVVALNLVGATALMGTILGSAGVIGLAVGFAVRDTLENYISSIMLSLRQPFRANDHVVIGDHEGKVIRLTSRATVLMTLDGNQLRIPNSMVFKSVILNYTRNAERRFDFELGVDANDDPMEAINTGLEALGKLDFVLTEPPPGAIIKAVGDSNIVLMFMAWVDQSKTGYGKARSVAIRSVITVLEEEGFTLPEPIYRLRFDGAAPVTMPDKGTELRVVESEPKKTRAPAASEDAIDVQPDTSIEKMVQEELTQDTSENLLDSDRPIE